MNGRYDEYIQDFVGNARRKESLGRPKCRWVVNIKIHLTEIWGGTNWIDPAQDRGQ
jgi:hypothetical protein